MIIPLTISVDEIYRICHELTVNRASLVQFYLNSKRMSDSFYHITESRELNLKNKVPFHTHGAI